MNERRRTLRLNAAQAGDVALAAELLREGGTVAFPTETVYGLGADALDVAAVEAIFRAKERPSWDPLIVHVSDEAMLRRVARLEGDVGERFGRMREAFWPGPLTMLLPRAKELPAAVTAGRERVGVRLPNHPVALALISTAGVPVAAPSANRFGRTSPTTAGHVLEDLDGRIDAVLDGGATTVGLESTVLDVAAWPMVVYRPGAVTLEQIQAVAREDVRLYRATATPRGWKDQAGLPSPGVGLRHYAPRARLLLVRGGAELRASGSRCGVMLPDGWTSEGAAFVYRWGPWGDGEMLARRLFDGLRWLDAAGAEVILCPLPQAGGIGDALRDRLEKAAISQ